MSLKKRRDLRRTNKQAAEYKLMHQRLSNENDAMFRYIEARLNLLSGFSELNGQLTIDDDK